MRPIAAASPIRAMVIRGTLWVVVYEIYLRVFHLLGVGGRRSVSIWAMYCLMSGRT